MANGVTLIAGHNVIMDSAYADEKFSKGEITNKQIITTQRDYDAVDAGRVSGYEEQSSVSAWAGVTEQTEEIRDDLVIAAEEVAREEAQGYVVNGAVDWTKVENEAVKDGDIFKVSTETSVSTVPSGIVTTTSETQEKQKLFEEFEEFLEWKRLKRGK